MTGAKEPFGDCTNYPAWKFSDLNQAVEKHFSPDFSFRNRCSWVTSLSHLPIFVSQTTRFHSTPPAARPPGFFNTGTALALVHYCNPKQRLR
jgi:hypothetical protein